jgi:photosystem II stability/assembly factor-like uncharacterized protein
VAGFETTPAVELVDLRWRMLNSLTEYYPKDARNTNFYKFLSAYADIMTDVDYEIDYTILDTGVDESRAAALYPNYGYFYTLPIRGDLNWGWDEYRFMLKVLGEAWVLYGSTAFGMRRVTQVATGVSPILLEHYKYAGWILDQFALGATAIVQTGDYVWNSVSGPALSAFNLRDVWPQQQTNVWVCGNEGINGRIWRSQNAGDSWYDTIPPVAAIYYSIHGISQFETWACGETAAGNGVVVHWHHTQGWDSPLTVAGFSLRGIWMHTPNSGWVCGVANRLYHWNGNTWTLRAVPGPAASLYAVHGVINGYVYVVGANSKVIRYNPSLDTWTDISVLGFPRDLYSVCAVDANTAFACGILGTAGTIVWTTDAGVNWNGIVFPGQPLRGIWASSDRQEIRAVGDNGVFLYSSDGGVTWATETYQGTGADLHAIYMRPNNTMGYICGNSGVLLRCNGQSPGFTLPNGEFVANGELINGAILESRHGWRNSVDVIVWNIMDYNLLWRFLNEMKPAHVKLFLMFEYPFLMDYYYDYYDFYTGAGGHHFLPDVGVSRGIVVNGRMYGGSMSKICFGEGDLYIPQLS